MDLVQSQVYIATQWLGWSLKMAVLCNLVLSPVVSQRISGADSQKVLVWSQAQTWNFCLKLLEYFTWAHGLSLNGFHKRSQSQLWLSHWLKCWDWLKVGLSFVNKGSNMAAIILSSLQNLKWLKIGYKYIKQPPEVVFGCFTCLLGFPLQNGI